MPSTSTDQQPIIDRDVLRQQFGDDLDLLGEIVVDYGHQRLEIMGEIRQSLSAGELDKAASGAHHIKGTLLTLGAQRAAAVAQEIEVSARNGDAATANSALPALERALDELQPVLESIVRDGF